MEWIDVNERLPEKAKFVIIHKHNGHVFGAYYNADSMFMYGEIDQTDQVTHWMPLPSPPQQPKAMTNDEKIIALRNSPEVLDAARMIIAAFDDMGLKSHIRFEFSHEGRNFELTMLDKGRELTHSVKSL